MFIAIKLASYHIPGVFSQHVYYTVEHGTRFFAAEVSRIKVIQTFLHFSCVVCYILRIYTSVLSKIYKAPYQIVYHSRCNSRLPCGNSWEYCRGAVNVGSLTPSCFIKK